MTKYVYTFGGKKAEGKADMKNLLGGKGANLAEMCLLGLPVPAGLTITTECCTAYYSNNCQLPNGLMEEVWNGMKMWRALWVCVTTTLRILCLFRAVRVLAARCLV